MPSHLLPTMFKQPIELSLVKFELLDRTLLHWVTPDSNTL